MGDWRGDAAKAANFTYKRECVSTDFKEILIIAIFLPLNFRDITLSHYNNKKRVEGYFRIIYNIYNILSPLNFPKKVAIFAGCFF